MEITEIIASLDFVIFLIVGIVVGGLYGQFSKGRNFLLSVVIGVVGSLISGFIFDWLDFMDLGDYADPIIAGTFGSVVLLALVRVSQGSKLKLHGLRGRGISNINCHQAYHDES